MLEPSGTREPSSIFPPHGRAQRLARELFLRSFFGEGTPEGVASRLSATMEDLVLPPSAVLYRRGEVAEDLYCVVSGRIALREDDEPGGEPQLEGHGSIAPPGRPSKPWIFGERSIIGINDTLLDRPRARTAVAITEVHLLRLRAARWFDMLEDNFGFARGVLVRMASGLEDQLDVAPQPAEIAAQSSLAALGTAAPPRPSTRVPPSLHVVERLVVFRSVHAFTGVPLEVLASLAELATVEVFLPGERLHAHRHAHLMAPEAAAPPAAPLHADAAAEHPRLGAPGPGTLEAPGSLALLKPIGHQPSSRVDPERAEANRDLLLLARGEVITVLPRGTILRFTAPALIGGLVAVTPVFDHRRIVAVSKCTVLRLPIADWFDAMEDHSELLRRAMATLTIEREEALARRAEGT